MKKYAALLLFLMSSLSFAQSMNNEKLETIFKTVSDSIQGQPGQWQFAINDIQIVCITDETNNRMRIISPIVEANKLDEKMKTNALIANFHTALDVKYAISDDILWSVFIHPLKELTEKQVANAVQQVFLANATFGTTYSSSGLVFPGSTDKDQPKKEPTQELLKQGI